ncbi:MAG TPA: hypothetical protein VFC52_05980 [Solirubrobacterales bacterium]|nr:hypothetical protein [Solirubrobacterales bacterium]
MATAMRESWTDERLDDFRDEVNRRFDSIDRRFEAVDRRLEQIDARLDDLNRAMLKMGQTMLWLGGGALITFIVGFVGLILTQL